MIEILRQDSAGLHSLVSAAGLRGMSVMVVVFLFKLFEIK